MPYQSPRNGIMQSSWSLERRPLIARFIHWLRRSRRSLINSSRKTWKQVESICLNLRWHLRSFSSRRKTVLYVMNDYRWTQMWIILLDSGHRWPIPFLDPPGGWQHITRFHPSLCLDISFHSFPFLNTASFCDSHYSMTHIMTRTTKPLTLNTAS